MWQSIVGIFSTIVSILIPPLAPVMSYINIAISAYTAIQTGNVLGLVGGIAGGIGFGILGKGLATSIAGSMSEAFANTFLGGAIIGAAEFGVAGFGAGLGGALASGASFSDAIKAGGVGALMGATTGALIEGSYMAGWQDKLHGVSKGEYVQARLNRAASFMRSGSTSRASSILSDLQKNYDMLILATNQFGPGGVPIHPDLYATTTSGQTSGVGFDFYPKTKANLGKVLLGQKVSGVFSGKDFSNIANMGYDLLILKSADPSVVNRAIPVIEGYVGKPHYYKLYGEGNYTCQNGIQDILGDIGR